MSQPFLETESNFVASRLEVSPGSVLVGDHPAELLPVDPGRARPLPGGQEGLLDDGEGGQVVDVPLVQADHHQPRRDRDVSDGQVSQLSGLSLQSEDTSSVSINTVS